MNRVERVESRHLRLQYQGSRRSSSVVWLRVQEMLETFELDIGLRMTALTFCGAFLRHDLFTRLVLSSSVHCGRIQAMQGHDSEVHKRYDIETQTGSLFE